MSSGKLDRLQLLSSLEADKFRTRAALRSEEDGESAQVIDAGGKRALWDFLQRIVRRITDGYSTSVTS